MNIDRKEEVVFSGNYNFSVVKITENGKTRTVLKHTGEVEFDDNSAIDFFDCLKMIVDKYQKTHLKS